MLHEIPPPSTASISGEFAVSYEIVRTAGPSPRSGHAMIRRGDEIVCQGGLGTDDQFFSSVWVFSLTTQTWRQQPTAGVAPEARFGSAHVLLNDNRTWFFHGGIGRFDRHFSDSFLLNLDTWHWTRLDEVCVAVTRCWGHSATSITIDGREKIVLIGGMYKDDCNDSVHIIDVATMKLQEIRSIRRSMERTFGSGRPHWMQYRRRHGACAYRNNFIIVFGGRNGDRFLNDMWAYNILLDLWAPLNESSTATEVDNFFSNPGLMRYGETLCRNFKSTPHSRLGSPDTYSSAFPRTGLSMLISGDHIFVFGGFFWAGISLNFNDLHVYDIVNHRWRAAVTQPAPDIDDDKLVQPHPTTMAALVKISDTKWFLYGGRYDNIPTGSQYIVTLCSSEFSLAKIASRWLKHHLTPTDVKQMPQRCQGLLASCDEKFAKTALPDASQHEEGAYTVDYTSLPEAETYLEAETTTEFDTDDADWATDDDD